MEKFIKVRNSIAIDKKFRLKEILMEAKCVVCGVTGSIGSGIEMRGN
jgi:hypothetical protein